MASRQHLRWIATAALFLVLAALACGPRQAGSAVTVTITSPASGTIVHVGEQVQVISMASAAAGVARVELRVNGQLVRTDAPPSGSPTSFAVAQQWDPVAPGEVTISVIAYDVNGAASEAAVITIRVEAGTAGVTPTPSVTQTPVPDVQGEGGCSLNASYVADVTIPDDTQLLPGTTFAKTWRIRNSGTCDWGSGFKLVFTSGDQMGAPGMVAVPPTAAGSTADVTVNMTAPATPGTYRGNWRMQSDTGLMFGSSVYVRIVVPAPVTETPTAGPTVTPTAPAPAGPTNLQCEIQADRKVRCTWSDAVGEATYRYEFSFAAGTVGSTESQPLPADTTSWTSSSALACDGDGSFTIIALAGDASEIGRQTDTFETAACAGPVTVDIQAGADSFWWPQNMICAAGFCPDWGHGSALELKNGSSGGGGISVFYPGLVAVRFDLGAIPAGATITQATLYLRLTDAAGASANLNVRRADSPWSEDDHSVKPTCNTSGAATRAVGTGLGWYDWDVTGIVQYQYANPTTNYGFCVSGGAVDDARIFASREASAVSRPYLRVVYQP